MNTRKIGINLESLWEENPNKFTLRYRDISEPQQDKLALRIKTTSTIETIRTTRGPTTETIKEILLEINPIIFSEGKDSRWGHPFAKNRTHDISGWQFKRLCQAVYYSTLTKRTLTATQVQRIAFTTSQDWDAIANIIENRATREARAEQARNPEPIGIQEIARLSADLAIPSIPREIQAPTEDYQQ